MRISEAAKITGLSVSNIRFYEKKGLLAPVREEESKYRDYSMEDIEQLKRIILYRKMNIPVETIYLLQKGEASFEGVLQRQEKELTAQREMLEGSIALCRKILASGDLQLLNVDYYLNYVHAEEESGKRFAQADEFLEDWLDFTRISENMYPLMGSRHFAGLAASRLAARVISLVIFAVYAALPAAVLWEQYHENGRIATHSVVFWLVWAIGLGLAFLYFRKSQKKWRKKEEKKEQGEEAQK